MEVFLKLTPLSVHGVCYLLRLNKKTVVIANEVKQSSTDF
jgi:hypothetical protein